MKEPPDHPLRISLSIHDSPSPVRFWHDSPHTSLCIAKRKRLGKEVAVIAVGCEDGSVWLLQAAKADKAVISPLINVIEPASGPSSVAQSRAPSLKAPSVLSRTSSYTFLNGLVNPVLSPPAVARGDMTDLQPTRKRAGSAASTATARSETFNPLGFLPSPRGRNTSVSQNTATARLASLSAADDKALRIKLKDINEHKEQQNGSAAGTLTKLVGESRGGLDELKGKADIALRDTSTDTTKVSAEDKRADKEFDHALHEEREMETLRSAVEVAEEKMAASSQCGTPSQTDIDGTVYGAGNGLDNLEKEMFMAQMVPIRSERNGVVEVMRLTDSKVLVLGEEGLISVIDVQAVEIIANLDLESEMHAHKEEGSSKPNFTPALHWQGLLPFSSAQERFFIAYGLAPTDSPLDQAKDLTTVVLLKVENEELHFVASKVLPGEGMVAVVDKESTVHLLHAVNGKLNSYPLTFHPTPTDPKVHKSHSHLDLKSVFSPLPTRPHSRASMERPPRPEQASSGEDFSKMLGRKLLGRASKAQSKALTVFNLGEVKEVEVEGLGEVLGMRGCGEKVVVWNDEAAQILHVGANGFELACKQLIALPPPVIDCIQGSRSDKAVLILEDCMLDIDLADGRSCVIKAPPSDIMSPLCAEFEGLWVTLTEKILTTAHSDRLADCFDEAESNTLAEKKEVDAANTVEAIMPFRDGIIAGTSDGRLCIQSFLDLLQEKEPSKVFEGIEPGYESRITCLRSISTPSKPLEMIFAGYEDGSVRVWLADTLDFIADLSAFAGPVKDILLPDSSASKSLSNRVVIVGSEGELAVLGLQEMRVLYLIPTSQYPMDRAVLLKDDLIIMYKQGRARVWNLESGEFRRSTSIDSASEMLASGDWVDIPPKVDTSTAASLALTFELDHWDSSNISPLSWATAFHDLEGIQESWVDALGLAKTARSAVMGSESTSYGRTYYNTDSAAGWGIGGHQTLLKQICIVSALHQLLHLEPTLAGPVSEAIAYYSAVLPVTTGSAFHEPDLDEFVDFYAYTNTTVQHAARLLFETRLSRIPDHEIVDIADDLMIYLPVNVSSTQKQSRKALKSMTLLGAIALQRCALLKPIVLKDLAASIMQALRDGPEKAQLIAIDLTAKGFDVWQAFADPADLLRSVFDLAVVKDLGTAATMSHARTAVLQLATSSATLFISTVTLDIVTAETVARRDAIMKLCVFIARRRPAILMTSLPRLAEAVVKSLDPTRVRMRDSIQQTATVILGELVKTFPSIDFAGKVQKLAVGTQEGAVIMYDLKTATRLYILETHKHAVSAVSFSPDGRRLVTACLEERKVTVWKVGSSFSGFINVGGPPRQGSITGEPFKSLDFFVVEGEKDVAFTWPGERNACLEIGKMKLKFAT